MLRLHEYSPVFDAARFAAHEKFFVEDVREWARSRFGVALPANRTAVFGVSAGRRAGARHGASPSPISVRSSARRRALATDRRP